MAKQNILIVDADPESARVLEVSLKKVGYSVTRAESGSDALELIGFSTPDLVISETALPQMDGFEFCTKLKENEEWANIPFIFLTAERSIEDKIRGLELGVDDYLTKPIFIREILVRVNLGLQRREKERLEHRGSKTKFSGTLQDMGVVDLIQTIDLGHKSGVIHIERPDDEGNIFFNEGRLVDAETQSRKGADAIYRMLVWSEGNFEIEFKSIDRKPVIELSTQGLLMEGMRRLDEWGRLQEQLPPLSSVFDIDAKILAERLGEIPDEVNSILRNFDGKASLLEVVDKGGLGDLEALTVITKLYFEGLISEVTESTGESLSQLEDAESSVLKPGTGEAVVRGEGFSESIGEDMGPRLSTVAQGLGFVAALTNPQQVVPRAKKEPLQDGDDVLSKPARTKKITKPGIPRSVPNDNDTIIGIKLPRKRRRDDTEEVPSYSAAAISDLGSQSSGDDDARETMEPRRDAREITAALDEEVPQKGDEGLSADFREEDESDYFEATSYKASLESPSDVQENGDEPAEDEEDGGQRDEEDFDEEDFDEGDFEEDDLEDYWEEEPSHRGRWIAIIIAVILVLGFGGVGFWLWYQDRADDYFDNAPIINTPEESYHSVLKVTDVKSPSRKPPGEAPGESAPDKVADVGASDDIGAEPSLGEPEKPPAEPKAAGLPAAEGADDKTEPQATAAASTPAPGSSGAPLDPAAQERYDTLMKKAESSGRAGKIKLLREALTINPDADLPLSLLAVQLMEGNQTQQEALSLSEKAVQINPDNGAAWMVIGYVHQLAGDVAKSQDAYKKCAACSGPKKFVRECRMLAR